MDSCLKKINKLVLSGGGAKGYAYIGLIQYLEEAHLLPQIRTILGTSIGALFGTMIAIGLTSREMVGIFSQYNYQDYESLDLMSIFEKFGVDTFDKTRG